MNNRQAFDVFNAKLIGSNLIEASAGTGKTWSITGIYLRMVVEQDLLPENILVVTFTKAATAELTGRIRKRLQQAMSWLNGQRSGDDADFFTALFEQWQGTYTEEQIQERLLKALARFDQAAIFTIHSFCQRLLNDYAFEAGAQFNLTPVTDSSEQLDIIAQDFWRLQMQQLIEADKGWVEWLVEKKQSPSTWLKAIKDHKAKPYQQVLAPQKGADEAEMAAFKADIDALKPALQTTLASLEAAQSACATLWEAEKDNIIACLQTSINAGDMKAHYKAGNLEGYINELEPLLTKHLASGFKKFTKKQQSFSQSFINGETKKGKESPEHAFFALMDAYIKALKAYREPKDQKNALVDSLKAGFEARLQRTLADLLTYVDSKFPTLKSELSIMDFDDMMLNIYNALNAEQGQDLANAVAKQFGAALVDEFQDTDPLQLKIFQSIFAKTKTPLFYVGDPKQAIYSFRGADIYAYYEGANAADTQQTLTTNYRSTPALVDSVNALFSPEHQSFVSNDISFDWVASNPKKELVIEGQSNAAMQFILAKNEEDKPYSKGDIEPIAIAETVQQIADILSKAKQNKAYFLADDGEKTPVNPADIAILVPTHKQAAMIAEALANQGVLSVRQGQDKVLESTAAYTVLRLMQAVAEPGNEAKITELLGDRLVGIQGHEVVKLKDSGAQWEELLEQFWLLKSIWSESGFSAMFRHWLSLKDSNGLTIPQRLTQYIDGERNLTDLMHLAEILQQRSRQQKSAKALISWMQYALNGNSNEDEHQLRLESDNQRVKIVTLHASKGLEYNVVFCPFLWQGKPKVDKDIIAAHQGENAIVDFGSAEFKESLKQADEEQLMEQIRLLYVALTRPVHRCVIFWANVQSKSPWLYTANSAMSWLLYGNNDMLEDPCGKIRKKMQAKFSYGKQTAGIKNEAFEAGLKAFCDNANSRQPADVNQNQAAVSYSVLEQCEDSIYVDMTQNEGDELTSANGLQRYLTPSWLQTSFSGLTSGQHATLERSERGDDVPETKELTTEEEGINTAPSIFNFPRGNMEGECLHSIFEHWDFDNTNKEQLKVLVADEMNRFGIAKPEERSQWYEAVSQCVLDTLHKPLSPSGFTLAQVNEADRQAELEFLLAARGSTDRIQALMADEQYQLPPAFVEASKQLSNKQIQGFLTGFIDLVFKDDEGRYHVLDWKSNHMGYTAGDYTPELVEHKMAETHYYLQALLYLLALHRYLQQQLPNYDIEKHLGGAWYAFVRGIDVNQPQDEQATGLYYFQPPAALIKALDESLVSQEVNA